MGNRSHTALDHQRGTFASVSGAGPDRTLEASRPERPPPVSHPTRSEDVVAGLVNDDFASAVGAAAVREAAARGARIRFLQVLLLGMSADDHATAASVLIEVALKFLHRHQRIPCTFKTAVGDAREILVQRSRGAALLVVGADASGATIRVTEYCEALWMHGFGGDGTAGDDEHGGEAERSRRLEDDPAVRPPWANEPAPRCLARAGRRLPAASSVAQLEQAGPEARRGIDRSRAWWLATGLRGSRDRVAGCPLSGWHLRDGASSGRC